MLAVHTPNALRRAVATEDVTGLTKVPGIGRKGAQRIVLELKDRLGLPMDDETPMPSFAAAAWRAQVHAGLTNLGWTARDAEMAVDAVAAEVEGQDTSDIAALLKMAMRKLSR
jgi:Holliday junction DNA helicase RuvA